jgi:D-aspartate ligase
MATVHNFDKTVPALILKLGRYVIHHGAVGIARSLGRVGVPVYAIVEDRCTPLAVSRYTTGAFCRTSDSKAPEALLSDLRNIAERLGRRSVLVPTDDVAAVFIAEHQPDLEHTFILTRLPAGLPRRLCNKLELHKLCRKLGIPTPATMVPRSLDDVLAFIETAVFPVVLKAAEAHRLPNGAPSVAIARTPHELIAAYRLAESPHCANLILQEYIPRDAEDWIFHGYRNPGTDCLVAFTGRKLRSWPPFAGPTTLGVCQHNATLLKQSEDLLRPLEYAGIMDLDYRLDKRDGQYKLLDFNPRIGANFRMFEDASGLDVVQAMHLDLTGRGVKPEPATEGRTLLVESHDFFASVGYMRQGALTPKRWWHSLRGNTELAWFTADDPAPFFVMWFRLLFRKLGSTFRRGGHRLERQGATAPP